MGWEIYPAQATFSTFAQDWDRLNARLYDKHPYFDSRFIGPLLKHFSSGNEHLCIYRDNDAVSGALILEAKGYGRWSSFRPSQAQITSVLLDDARLLEELFPVLPGPAWLIELIAVDPRYSPNFLDLSLPQINHAQARTIGIQTGISFTDYWDARAKNLRANVRRYLNRSEAELGSQELTTLNQNVDMTAAVTRYGSLETAGWKGAAGTAVSADNAQGAFYSDVLGQFAHSDQAKVYELHLGNQLAASRLVLVNEHMAIILKTAYNEALARLAPGRLLLYRIIEERLERRLGKTIEFYTNATRDQMEWATFACNIQSIQLFRNRGFATAYELLQPLKSAVTSTPRPMMPPEGETHEAQVLGYESESALATANYDLQQFSAKETIETSIDWFDLLQKNVYPHDTGVRYYVIAENDRASTILPLRLVTKGRIRSIEALGNYYTSLYTPLHANGADPLALQEALAAATREHVDAHVMRFSPMDPKSADYKCLINGIRALGWIPFRFFCFGNWFLSADDDWEGYLKGRSANLRSSIKRRNKYFAAAGGTLEVVTTSDAIEQTIAIFQGVYSASWKIPEPYPEFVPSLIRRLASLGMLRLGIARVEGRAIAAQIWIVGRDKASIYKVAYDEAFASYSPGTVLTSFLMQHVIEWDHVKEVDFLIGDDKYKQIWMSDRRERWGIIAYNPRTAIGLTLMVMEMAGRLTKSAGKKAQDISQKTRRASMGLAASLKNIWLKRLHSHTPSPETKLTWTVHPVTKLSSYAAQWDALVRHRPGTPFLESAFLQPIVEIFGNGDERLCMLHSHGQLRAAAIMQRRRMGMWQTFQPSQLPLGAWISDGSADLVPACEELAKTLPGLNLGIGVSQLDSRIQSRPEDSPKVRCQDYIQTSWIDIEGTFESYWEARGKNLKQNTRKQRNKLQAEGIETRIECLTAPQDVAKAIEDYGLLESAGWKATDGTAIRPDNDQGRFYRKMLENYCALGRGRIYRYWFGEKIVAMDLCIHDQVAVVILKTTYDESYKTVSPSTLMRHEQFQQLFAERNCSRIEFFGKVMEWHTRWTTKSRTIFHATFYRWGSLKMLHERRTALPDKADREQLSNTRGSYHINENS